MTAVNKCMFSFLRFSSGFLSRSLFLAVILSVLFVYAPSLSNDFVNWDDDVHLLENRFVRSLDLKNIKDIFSTTVNHTYIPLTTLTFALEYHWFGADPFIYHLNNLLLHLVVTALVMALAKRLGLSVAASALAGIIFGIHPMHVESVAWVTQRKDVLYSVFYLSSVLVYLRYLDSSRKRYLLFSIALGILSILAKSMALSLPIVLLLCDWFYKGRVRWRDVFNKGYFAVVMMPIVWISYYSNAGILKAYALQDLLVWIWCFNFYLMNFILPGDAAMFYPLPYPVSVHDPVYLSNMIMFFGFGIWLWIRRYDRLMIFAVLFYLGSIFFLLRFQVILDSVADRFMYLPSVGLCMFFAVVIERLIRSSQRNFLGFYAILCALTVVLCTMFLMTHNRTMVWKDSVSLWQNQLASNPKTGKWLAYSKLGDAYFESPQVKAALARLANGQVSAPGYTEGQRRADTDHIAVVIDLYRKAIQDKPDYAEPYYHLGRVYQSLGDVSTAVHFYEEACQRNRSHDKALLRLGRLYKVQGRTQESVEAYKTAILVNPHNTENLAEVEQVFQKAMESGEQPEMYRAAKEQLKVFVK